MSDARDSEEPESQEASEAAKASVEAEPAEPAPPPGGPVRSPRWLAGVGPALAGVVVGLAGGWFGHQVPALAAIGGDPAACETWRQTLCDGAGGSESAACAQVRSAAELMSEGTCRTALRDLPHTAATLQASRADCQTVIERLCADLGKETKTCKMVEEKTPAFPADRCTAMLSSYDQVIGQLRQMEARGGPDAAMGAGPGPRMHARPGPGGPGRSPGPHLRLPAPTGTAPSGATPPATP